MARDALSIKGTSDGLVITLPDGPLDTVLDEMTAHLSSAASFFVGGRVALRVGDRSLSATQIQAIGKALEEQGVTLWAVEGTHPVTCASARTLGLETSLRRSVTAATRGKSVDRDQMAGVVVHGTLRSGQALQHPGHITLIGDLNPGAELVASGDIVVWGKLRGMVHAGAAGDDEAVICALQLAPNQIRIGSYIARPPERAGSPGVPEVARVQDGAIVVEAWDSAYQQGTRFGAWRLGNWNLRLKALLGHRRL